MTEESGSFAVGFCPYSCFFDAPYYSLPCNISELERRTCPTPFNRHGYLCSQCTEGHGLPAYSYSAECVRCENYKYNWLKYLAVAYLPLTLFYVFVALFTINFASPTLSGVVTMFQTIMNPYVWSTSSGVSAGFFALGFLFNLDFFRDFFSFCLYPSASAMTITALQFALGIFPFFLIWLTFLLVKTHDHNFKLVVWLWKALSKILNPVTQNVKTSLVEVFASFIYLSCSRLLWTSIYFLIPSTVYFYPHGDEKLIETYRVLIDPSVIYFGEEHLPFAVLAIVISTCFFTIPLVILFLYPCSCFQHLLNKLGWNSSTLRTFMDVFQGHYKNGTNGSKDYRFFSGFILLFPLIVFLTFVLTKSIIFHVLSCIWIILYITLHLVFMPFKCAHHNYTVITMLTALLGAYWGVVLAIFSEQTPHLHIFFVILLSVSLSVPYLYLLGLVVVLIRRWWRNRNAA